MKIHDFKDYKIKGKKISMLTCYDYPSAKIVSNTKIDSVLIGDSVAMTVHGHPSTVTATMPMMIMHTNAVSRAITQQFIVTDLPFLSYRISLDDTMKNVLALIQAGAHAVKVEGCDPDLLKTISHIVTSGIPVMGHIGLTPQSVHQLGGYKIQGKDEQTAKQLQVQAKNLEDAGCFAIVLECAPAKLASVIASNLSIPVIGIGAGLNTDGQILVWHDLLGLQNEFKPKFVRQFINSEKLFTDAINEYVNEIQLQSFPTSEHSF